MSGYGAEPAPSHLLSIVVQNNYEGGSLPKSTANFAVMHFNALWHHFVFATHRSRPRQFARLPVNPAKAESIVMAPKNADARGKLSAQTDGNR